jgi:hypothetical protein
MDNAVELGDSTTLTAPSHSAAQTPRRTSAWASNSSRIAGLASIHCPWAIQRRRNASRSMASCIHELMEVPSVHAQCLTTSYRSSGSAMVALSRACYRAVSSNLLLKDGQAGFDGITGIRHGRDPLVAHESPRVPAINAEPGARAAALTDR